MITAEQKLRFAASCELTVHSPREENRIGELSEKTIHATLKHYIEPDTTFQEIKTEGFVADIKNPSGICEIQTRQFFKLKRKLDAFLPANEVTIVYPLCRVKYLSWIDPETGEISRPHKSPRKGTPYALLYEMYGIREYLDNPHLHFKIVEFDSEEYKYLNGWSRDRKRGASRCDGFPTELVDELDFYNREDFAKLVPEGLICDYTVKDFAKVAKISAELAGVACNVLYHMGIIERIGKKGNAYIYCSNLIL